jgi:DHA1 family arabinose polymer transporter-like MFS transporter
MQHAEGGEMMGGAMGQLAFNLGNSLGAFSGGETIKTIGMHFTPLTGAGFVVLGSLLFNYFDARKKGRAW